MGPGKRPQRETRLARWGNPGQGEELSNCPSQAESRSEKEAAERRLYARAPRLLRQEYSGGGGGSPWWLPSA